MNTTQNTRRIIAAALVAASAGLVLASCATPQVAETAVQPLSAVQVAQFRAGYLEFAERRAEMYRDLADARAAAASVTRDGLRDLAESRAEMYRGLAQERGGADIDEGARRYDPACAP